MSIYCLFSRCHCPSSPLYFSFSPISLYWLFLCLLAHPALPGHLPLALLCLSARAVPWMLVWGRLAGSSMCPTHGELVGWRRRDSWDKEVQNCIQFHGQVARQCKRLRSPITAVTAPPTDASALGKKKKKIKLFLVTSCTS